MPKLQDILADPALNGVYRLAAQAELAPVLDGDDLREKSELLAALGRALDFPDYYGGNWDALEECLLDLSWRQGALWLLIRRAGALPAGTRATLCDIFADAARHWAQHGRVCSLFLSGLKDGDLPAAL